MKRTVWAYGQSPPDRWYGPCESREAAIADGRSLFRREAFWITQATEDEAGFSGITNGTLEHVPTPDEAKP